MTAIELPDGIDNAIRAIRRATASALDGHEPQVHEVLTAISWARGLDETLRASGRSWPFGWADVPAEAADPEWMRGLNPIRNASLHRVAEASNKGFVFPVKFPITFDSRWVSVDRLGPWGKHEPDEKQRTAHARFHEGRRILHVARVLGQWAEHLDELRQRPPMQDSNEH